MFKKTVIVAIIIILGFGCKEKYTPKPRGYFRIDFPEKEYVQLSDRFPYSFEIPVYSEITPDRYSPDEKDWINITVPANKAEIHISYYVFDNDNKNNLKSLAELMEESHSLAYKHTIKADAIKEKLFMNPENNVYGLVYRIEGNAASPMQFYLTDSTRHFLRGALYIRQVPNIDSIQPVIRFLEPDVIHIIETTHWK